MTTRQLSIAPLTNKQLARFWAKVNIRKPDNCWPWIASRIPDGYGSFKLMTGITVLAHRATFFIAHGWWPPVVRHACDTPSCCNDAHLLAGTQADNVADRDMRERRTITLRAADIPDIRAQAAAGKLHREIAAAKGVARTTITRIINGTMWKHI